MKLILPIKNCFILLSNQIEIFSSKNNTRKKNKTIAGFDNEKSFKRDINNINEIKKPTNNELNKIFFEI